MYEWLTELVSSVATNKFFVTAGPPPADLSDLIDVAVVPPSYKRFIKQFGESSLFRSYPSYWIKVFGAPREARSTEGEPLLHIGFADETSAYFKKALLVDGEESPVFGWHNSKALGRIADSFDLWLESKCRAARRHIKKAEWDAIVKGPAPFSASEHAIVEARARFRWRVVGIADNEDLLFEVHNGSDLSLPYLSIGIRGESREGGSLNGGACLPIHEVTPGVTKVIAKGCYKQWVDPKNIEPFDLPSPEPEDRDRYWEFRATSPPSL